MPKITRHGGPSNAADAEPVEPVAVEDLADEPEPEPTRNVRVRAGVARGSAKAGKAGKQL